MNKPVKEFVLPIIEEILHEGEELKNTKFNTGVKGRPHCVDLQGFGRWISKLKSLAFILGELGKPWKDELTRDYGQNAYPTLIRILGLLEAIKYAIEKDHLVRAEKLIRAETLTDLLEQADYLFNQGYFIAAGVLARAVIEEHLRKRCDDIGCSPSKDRPTLNDFNQALYTSKIINKITMKHIDVLAAIGNDAAHNKPSLKSDDVQRLICEVPDVLQKV